MKDDKPSQAEMHRRSHVAARASAFLDIAANALLKAQISVDDCKPSSKKAKAIRERIRRIQCEAFALAIDVYEVTP